MCIRILINLLNDAMIIMQKTQDHRDKRYKITKTKNYLVLQYNLKIKFVIIIKSKMEKKNYKRKLNQTNWTKNDRDRTSKKPM